MKDSGPRRVSIGPTLVLMNIKRAENFVLLRYGNILLKFDHFNLDVVV